MEKFGGDILVRCPTNLLIKIVHFQTSIDPYLVETPYIIPYLESKGDP